MDPRRPASTTAAGEGGLAESIGAAAAGAVALAAPDAETTADETDHGRRRQRLINANALKTVLKWEYWQHG